MYKCTDLYLCKYLNSSSRKCVKILQSFQQTDLLSGKLFISALASIHRGSGSLRKKTTQFGDQKTTKIEKSFKPLSFSRIPLNSMCSYLLGGCYMITKIR